MQSCEPPPQKAQLGATATGSTNVWRYLQANDNRPDITKGLKKLTCRTLIFVDNSHFLVEALHMIGKLDRRYSVILEVQVGANGRDQSVDLALNCLEPMAVMMV
ncbi:pollen-specific protein SF21-like protein isoform X2 [Tanacetum coccineum]